MDPQEESFVVFSVSGSMAGAMVCNSRTSDCGHVFVAAHSNKVIVRTRDECNLVTTLQDAVKLYRGLLFRVYRVTPLNVKQLPSLGEIEQACVVQRTLWQHPEFEDECDLCEEQRDEHFVRADKCYHSLVRQRNAAPPNEM